MKYDITNLSTIVTLQYQRNQDHCLKDDQTHDVSVGIVCCYNKHYSDQRNRVEMLKLKKATRQHVTLGKTQYGVLYLKDENRHVVYDSIVIVGNDYQYVYKLTKSLSTHFGNNRYILINDSQLSVYDNDNAISIEQYNDSIVNKVLSDIHRFKVSVDYCKMYHTRSITGMFSGYIYNNYKQLIDHSDDIVEEYNRQTIQQSEDEYRSSLLYSKTFDDQFEVIDDTKRRLNDNVPYIVISGYNEHCKYIVNDRNNEHLAKAIDHYATDHDVTVRMMISKYDNDYKLSFVVFANDYDSQSLFKFGKQQGRRFNQHCVITSTSNGVVYCISENDDSMIGPVGTKRKSYYRGNTLLGRFGKIECNVYDPWRILKYE